MSDDLEFIQELMLGLGNAEERARGAQAKGEAIRQAQDKMMTYVARVNSDHLAQRERLSRRITELERLRDVLRSALERQAGIVAEEHLCDGCSTRTDKGTPVHHPDCYVMHAIGQAED